MNIKKKFIILGGSGFIGSNIALSLAKKYNGKNITVIDNLSRKGSSENVKDLKKARINFLKKNVEDIEILDLKFLKNKKSYIIDAAANPAVTAGMNTGIYNLFQSNLMGLVKFIDIANYYNSKFIFLSSSRIYELNFLKKIKLKKNKTRFIPSKNFFLDENSPVTLDKTFYGQSKFFCENLLFENSIINTNFKYIILRPGVVAGPRQKGTSEQGFISHWINCAFLEEKLNYIGYNYKGFQVRDVLHIDDLEKLVVKILKKDYFNNNVYTIGGGLKNSTSLSELTLKCEKFTKKKIKIDDKKIPHNLYDCPYIVMSNKKIKKDLNFSPKKNIDDIINDIIKFNKKLNKY
jgi:CDP-paratose 2-epimerase